jgi:type 2 lantibiotic biosynthesis protein LanM
MSLARRIKKEEMYEKSMVLNISSKQQVLATIAARASTPPERFQVGYVVNDDPDDYTVNARRKRLYELLEVKDDAALTRLFAPSLPDLRYILGTVSSSLLEESSQQLHWIETLERIIDATSSPLIPDRCLEAISPVPFEELLVPFVQYARDQLQIRAANSYTCLSEQAHINLEKWLLQSLAELSGQAFQREFSIFRMEYSPQVYEENTHRDLYERFLEGYRGEQIWSFFLEYSVLARLLVLRVEQWGDACQELLLRLQTDHEAIAEAFFEGRNLGPIVDIKAGCSDPHRHGRTVFLLTFNSGDKLVYKPRNMSVDCAFSDLLAWVNACGISPTLKVSRVLNRAMYGWMEYIPSLPCQSQQEVVHYYQRVGMLLCLLYLLDGVDIHEENLIACGDMPVIIDLETVISTSSPTFSLLDSPLPHNIDTVRLTVVDSGLLPGKFRFRGGRFAIDISALGGSGEEIQESFRPVPQWKHINTNAMVFRREVVRLEEELPPNRVKLHDRILQPQDYQAEIIEGFCRLYHLLAEKRAGLLAPEGPLASFAGCLIRYIVCDTDYYGFVLDQLCSPIFLRDGTDRWIEMQILKRPLLKATTASWVSTLFEAELAALERLDIPWFGTHTESRDLLTETGVVLPNVFAFSALEQARRHLSLFGEEDCNHQVNLIRATFLSFPSVTPHTTEGSPVPAESLDEVSILPSEGLLNVAQKLARDLIDSSLRNGSGDMTWIGFHYDQDIEGYKLLPLGFGLYSGTSGVALFLAALAWLTSETLYRDCALAALNPLAEYVRKSASFPVEERFDGMNIGGAVGLGSCFYALTHIGQWLDRPDILQMAIQLALLITPERVQADRNLDVMGGAAGALLSLLALYQVTANEELLQRAILCGRHLLERRVETQTGPRAWPDSDGIALTGFSHGAAGTAYALLQLFAVTHQQEFLDAACEGIDYERSVFVPEEGWPDLRKSAQVKEDLSISYVSGWCHGGTGIGLGRLGGLNALDTPEVRHEIEIALEMILAHGLPSLDNLCCGNVGRIEFLLATAQRLGRPDLLERAQKHASLLVRRASQEGDFHVVTGLPRHANNPGLYQGRAGIGYELLRLAFPERLPCILLWE